MENSLIIPETDILIATVIYLVERGVNPYQFSVPRGKGIDTDSTKNKLENAFKSIGISPTFSNSGADVLAISEKEWWHIECKGAGSGKAQTQRNNFDRALSSVVSYYGNESLRLPEQFRDTVQYLGLSLPATDLYLRELTRRVRKPLRQRLNLWILLYDLKTKKIRCIEPNQEF
jgi:hypothetical protein